MNHLNICRVEKLENPASTMVRLRDARNLFLQSERLPESIRTVVGRAWLRSHISGVNPAMERISVFKEPQMNPDVCQATEQVCRLLGQLVQGTRAVAIVSDPDGTIVRVTGDLDVLRQLERVQAVSKAVLAEEVCGANAVGTALEERVGIQMWAGEHFIEGFQPFTCTAVPVFHPLTRRLLGVIDVTILASEFSDSAADYLARWVQRAALEVEWDIYQRTLPNQQALFFNFLDEIRKRQRKYLVATDGEITIATQAAAELLNAEDFKKLADYVAEIKDSHCSFSTELVLSSGIPVAVTVIPKWEAGKFVGALLVIKVMDSPDDELRQLPAPIREIAGNSQTMREAVKVAVAAVSRRRSVCICGEPGVGKYTLAVALAGLLGTEPEVIDFRRLDRDGLEGVARQALGGGGVVILRHLEALDPVQQELLAEVIGTYRRPYQVLLATITSLSETGFEIQPKLATVLAEVVVRVPPLRERREDILQIAEQILKRHIGKTHVRLSKDAAKLLVTARWPGNIRQLEDVLLTTLVNTTDWVITSRSLRIQPNVVSLPRRVALTRIEEAELMEIAQALRESRGNISRAAGMLGISRSTLYRKLKAYDLLGYGLDYLSGMAH